MKYIINFSSIALVCVLCLACFSCSNRGETFVEIGFDYEQDLLEYNNQIYGPLEFYSISSWHLSLLPDQITQVGKMPFALLRAFSRKPVYATLEDVPCFLIVSYNNGEDINPYRSSSYIRKDIELTSQFETVYGNVYIKYSDDAQEKDKIFGAFGDGMTFNDLVVGDPLSEEKLNNFTCVSIAQIYCSHFEFDYLQCGFPIVRGSDNKYYLNFYEYPNNYYYSINPQIINSFSES